MRFWRSTPGLRSTLNFQPPFPLTPLEPTLPKVYVNKGLYLPLDSTLTKKPGGEGAPELRVTRCI
jgi:hypothetical protein